MVKKQVKKAPTRRRKEVVKPESSKPEFPYSEKYIEVVFNNFYDGILVSDIATKEFVFGNLTISRMLGYSLAELKTLSVNDIHREEDLPDVIRAFERLANQEITVADSIPVKRKDDSVFYADINAFRIVLEGNNCIVGIFRDITERQQVKAALSESEERFRRLTENAPDVIYRYRLLPSPAFEYISPAVLKLSGYSPEDYHADPMLARKLVHPDDIQGYNQHFINPELLRTPLISRWINRNGQVIWTEEIDSPVFNAQGNLIAFEGIVRDITARIEAEAALRKSEEQYRLLAEHMTDTVWLMDLSFKPLYLSPSIEKVRGFTRQEIMEMPYERNITPASFKQAYEVFLRELPLVESDPNYNPVITLEVEFTCKDGTTKWAESTFSVIRDQNGKPVSILGEGRDISERKKMEQALRDSEALYRLLAEHVTDAVWLLDFNLKITYVSPSAEKLIGFRQQEILEMPLERFVTPASYRLAYAAFLEETKKLEADHDYDHVLAMELEYYRRDGTTAWVENKFSVIRDENGRPISILGEARDITDRKKAEEALLLSKTLLAQSQEIAHVGSWTLDVVNNVLTWSDETYRIFGLEAQEFAATYEAFLDAVHPEDRAVVDATYSGSLQEGRDSYEVEHRVVRKRTGEIRTVYEKCIHERDAAWIIVRSVGMVQDITERKKAEEALRESDALYRLLAEHTTDAVWLMDMNLNTTYISPSSIKRRGYTPDEVIEMSVEQNLTPESFKLAMELVDKELPRILADPDYNPVNTLELEFYRKDGTTILSESTFSIIRDSEGKAVSILGESRDITEHRQVEKALLVSEAQYRLLAEHTTDTIFLMDMDLKMTYHSPSGEKLRGFTVKEIMEMPLEKTLSPESLQRAAELFFEEIPRVLADPHYNPVRIADFEYSCKDGSTVWAETKFSIIRDEYGKAVSILGEGRDITDRKKAENALRASEALYRLLSEHTTDFVWLMDMNLKPTYQSPSAEKLTGFTYQELVELPFDKRVTPDSLRLAGEAFLREIPRVLTDPGHNPVITLELEIMRKDGTTFWSENKFTVIRDENGNPVSIMGEARDVTERKQVEEALRSSEEKYRAVVENAREAMTVAVNGVFRFVNRRTLEITGYTFEELTSRPFIEFVHSADRQMVADRYSRRLEGQEVPETFVFRAIFKAWDIRWIELTAVPITWEGVPATLSFMTDITERKKMEEEQQRVSKLESLGVLAGGIAHDFNNILTTILGNVSLAAMETKTGSETQDRLEDAQKALIRAKDLTGQLLTFASGGAPIKKLAPL